MLQLKLHTDCMSRAAVPEVKYGTYSLTKGVNKRCGVAFQLKNGEEISAVKSGLVAGE